MAASAAGRDAIVPTAWARPMRRTRQAMPGGAESGLIRPIEGRPSVGRGGGRIESTAGTALSRRLTRGARTTAGSAMSPDEGAGPSVRVDGSGLVPRVTLSRDVVHSGEDNQPDADGGHRPQSDRHQVVQPGNVIAEQVRDEESGGQCRGGGEDPTREGAATPATVACGDPDGDEWTDDPEEAQCKADDGTVDPFREVIQAVTGEANDRAVHESRRHCDRDPGEVRIRDQEDRSRRPGRHHQRPCTRMPDRPDDDTVCRQPDEEGEWRQPDHREGHRPVGPEQDPGRHRFPESRSGQATCRSRLLDGGTKQEQPECEHEEEGEIAEKPAGLDQ